MSDEKESSFKIINENKKARFTYSILENFEAGLQLTGAEIKSVRQGGVSLAESFVRPDGNELFIIGMHIRPYEFSPNKEYNPTRTRKLLLHRREIHLLSNSVERKGLTIVPLKIYLKRGRAKLEIALAKGKAAPDKRQSQRVRDLDRQAHRALKSGGRTKARRER